jgi:uncharacterized YigZ family protein
MEVAAANNILSEISKIEKGATHNCYAYRILADGNVIERKSDDGEPGGTAGAPMLAVLAGNELINVLAVTTRYFGGIKLGTGGLAAAYKKGVVQVLKECTIVPYRQTDKYMLIFGFSESRLVEYLIEKNGFCVTKKDFGSDVRWTLALTAEEAQNLSGMIKDKDIILERICCV